MIPVIEILNRVSRTLNDDSRIRWTEPELIKYVNDGATEIVIRRVQAGAKMINLELVAGTRQETPPNANLLLDVVRNKVGKPVSRADRKIIDDQYPDWHTETAASAIQHFMYDDRLSNVFWVYPPAQAGVTVEALVSQNPTSVIESTDSVDLSEQYMPPLVNYVLARALSKESEFGNANLAVAYFNAFNESIGTNNQMSVTFSPNQVQP